MENTDLNNELRSILDTDGALTDEQVARVDAIETELAALETEARSADARAKAEARLNKASFASPAAGKMDSRSELERFADWAIAGDVRALTTTNDSALVPLDLQNELVTKLNGVSGVRQVVDVKSYGHDVEIARVASRPSITDFTGETVGYDDIESAFDKVRSYAFKSAAVTTITEELAQDSRPAVLAEIMEAQMQAHGLFWDKQYAVDGAGGASGPEAIFNSSQTGLNVHETAAIDTITIQDIMDAMLGTLPAQYRAGNFSLLMHPTVEQVLRSEKDDAGRYQLLPQATGTSAGLVPGATIMGVPVVLSTNAPSLTTAQAGTAPAAMLIERSSYRIFDRMPLSTMRDEYTGAATGQVKFLSKMRSDGRWLAPWRSVAIDLKQS